MPGASGLQLTLHEKMAEVCGVWSLHLTLQPGPLVIQSGCVVIFRSFQPSEFGVNGIAAPGAQLLGPRPCDKMPH